MNDAIAAMLTKYQCQSTQDYINAIKEILQEIALLGLWRAKFFEHAAFYGGTALRILYGLDRFSEDLDFSLLAPAKSFTLHKYNQAIKDELAAFDFEVTVEPKHKTIDSNKQLLTIKNGHLTPNIHPQNLIKIKMEIDTNPPINFNTESKTLIMPIPFTVLSYTLPDLFAGKMHAILCRTWQTRVKGRDWYDFYWFVSRNVPINLTHLQTRLIASGHWQADKKLCHEDLINILQQKITSIDFNAAKKDVINFLKDKTAIALWSAEFFMQLAKQLQTA